MMLPTQGPQTSLMEDLAELGLSENKADPAKSIAQHKEPDAKGGDFAGPPKYTSDQTGENAFVNAGDTGAGHRTDVPVRSDSNVGPKGPEGSKRGGAKNEDDDAYANN